MFCQDYSLGFYWKTTGELIMVKIIHVRTSGDLTRVVRSISRIQTRLPQMTRNGIRRWGKVLERDMKNAAMDAGIKRSTGTLFDKGIECRQGKKSDHGHLFMRIYGIYLSEMKPHFVSVHRRRRRILRWARIARSSIIKRQARMIDSGEKKSFSVYVKPHPFISQGYRRSIPKLNLILKSNTRRAIQMI